jgi:hypothetical protein
MSFVEFQKRADEADKRLAKLQALYDGGAKSSGGDKSELEEFKATFLQKLKEMRKVAAKEADEMAALKKANAALEAKNTQLEAKIAHLTKDLTKGAGGAGGDKADKAAKKKADKAAKKAANKAKGGGEQQMSKADKKKAEAAEEAKKKEGKLLKAAIKEGGKKGQDICGLNEMGGVLFYHITTDNSFGRWDLLEATMGGFNAEIDPEAEDRKGGASHLGKALFSAGDDKLIAYVNVPKKVESAGATGKEWAESFMLVLGPGAKIVEAKGDFLKIEAPKDENANLYPLKMRDAAIGLGFDFLRKRKLVVDADSDDDIDFGAQAAAGGVEWGAGDY